MKLPLANELTLNSHNHRSRSRPTRDLLAVATVILTLAACANTPTTAPPVLATAPPTPAIVVSTPTRAAPLDTPAPNLTAPATVRTLVFFAEAADNVGAARLGAFAQEQGWQLETASAREAEARLAHGPVAVAGVAAELSAAQWLALAQQYPAVYFVVTGLSEAGVEIPANLLFVGGAGQREDQAGLLAGVTAGIATETQRVAVFSETATPAGLKYRNGFTAGVRFACPRCELDVIELPAASEPVFAEAEGRKYALLGADVIFAAAGDAGTFALAGAAQNGAWVIAGGSSLLPGSERALTQVSLDVAAAIESALAAFAAGQPRSGVEPLAVANGGVTLEPIREGVLGPLDLQEIEAVKQKLAEGSLETGVDPVTGEER